MRIHRFKPRRRRDTLFFKVLIIVGIIQAALLIGLAGVLVTQAIIPQEQKFDSVQKQVQTQQPEQKRRVRLFTHFVHSENGMFLYGFYTEEERTCYREITTVSGIGSKVALKILSSISVKDFIVALDSQDVKRLSRLPGLGAKTAQKLILQLRDTLVLVEDEASEKEDVQTRKTGVSEYSDLVESLVDMGYDRKRVRDDVAKLLKENEMDLFGKSHEEKERFLFSRILKRR